MNTDKNLEIETHATTEEALAEYPEKELTGNILRGAFAVHNVLGAGFLERVYSNALAVELARQRLTFVQNQQLQVIYRDVIV
ncbi:MAG: GxxExxY protein, partial [Candidatus Acidiferrales bacterium]